MAIFFANRMLTKCKRAGGVDDKARGNEPFQEG